MTARDPDDPPIVALVLGAAVWPGGEPSPTLRRRSLHAAQLFRDGRVSHIIGCGGVGRHPPSEASVIREICRAEGVPDDAILLEDLSTSTRENIARSLPFLEQLGTRRIAIVTDGYHLPRARMMAQRMGLDCADVPAPPRAPLTLKGLKARLREVPAFLWYLLRRHPQGD